MQLLEKLDNYRKQAKTTKKQLCNDAEISTAMYHRYIAGKSAINLEQFQRLAEALSLKVTISL